MQPVATESRMDWSLNKETKEALEKSSWQQLWNRILFFKNNLNNNEKKLKMADELLVSMQKIVIIEFLGSCGLQDRLSRVKKHEEGWLAR